MSRPVRWLLAGTAAVIGVLAVGAVLVPPLFDGAGRVPVATVPADEMESARITNDRGAEIVVDPAEVPTLVQTVVGRDGAGGVVHLEGFPNHEPDAGGTAVHFLWEGTLTVLLITPGQPAGNCGPQGRDCTPVAGALVRTDGPTDAQGVTMRSATGFRDGWRIDAQSSNAPERNGTPPVLAEPPLSHADLVEVVTSEEWFR